MKKNCSILLLIFAFSHQIFAQTRSENLQIGGEVKQAISLTINDLRLMKVVEGTDFKVIGSKGELKKEFKTYKGILLKDLLEKAEVSVQNPKEKGKLYIVATATDGYTALFAYQDIFNNPTGENVLILFEENGQPIDADGAFVLITRNDKITGPRHVKWLQKIEVRKI